MTATLTTPDPTARRASLPVVQPGSHYRFADVARSEWTKLRTVRSSRWTIVAFAGLTIGLGVLVSAISGHHYPSLHPADRALYDPTNVSLIGQAFGELALGILGALTMTGEFGTGSIKSTLAAVPRRRTVLLAKAAVFGAVAFVSGQVITFVTFLLGQAVIGQPATTLGAPGVLQALLLSGTYLALVGLFGLGLATIIRHSAGAIGAFVGFVLVLPLVLFAIPGNAVRFAPETMLGSSVAITVHESLSINPFVATGLMALYAALALVLGGWLLERRDA